MMAVKRHRISNSPTNPVYLSGWMVAALRSDFGPLPDQSMHEKTAVSGLIEEIYTFLREADARELRHLFVDLDEARKNGGDDDTALAQLIIHKPISCRLSLILMPVLAMRKPLTCWPNK